eukprot:31355-Pelagococcus_subviridis.AAC.5
MRSSVEVRTREKTKTSGRRETTARGRRRARAIGDRGRARDANAATRAPSEDAIARAIARPRRRARRRRRSPRASTRFARKFRALSAAAERDDGGVDVGFGRAARSSRRAGRTDEDRGARESVGRRERARARASSRPPARGPARSLCFP